MIEEPDHEVFEVLDSTIEENDRLKGNLSVSKEIIRKHKWMMNKYWSFLTQKEKDIEELSNVLKSKRKKDKKEKVFKYERLTQQFRLI